MRCYVIVKISVYSVMVELQIEAASQAEQIRHNKDHKVSQSATFFGHIFGKIFYVSDITKTRLMFIFVCIRNYKSQAYFFWYVRFQEYIFIIPHFFLILVLVIVSVIKTVSISIDFRESNNYLYKSYTTNVNFSFFSLISST